MMNGLDFAGKYADPSLLPGELRGFRAWKWGKVWAPDMSYQMPGLHGLHPSYGSLKGGWTAGINQAECRRCSVELHHGPAPATNCSCGFYAYYRRSHDSVYFNDPETLVIGVIAASGRIQLGTLGFRCERARILAVFTNNWFVKDTLQDHFIRTDVEICRSVRKMLNTYPPDDLTAIGIPYRGHRIKGLKRYL